MATLAGPDVLLDGLVFGYDTGDVPLAGFDNRVDKRRYFAGKPMTNFLSDGHFPNGNDMSSEAGSNATNEIVLLENPGESPYVLKQTGGPSTEYELRLTNELAASTTYVMSGWYAESLDYTGDSRMFHARANGSSGNNNSTGAGFYNQIKSKVVGGLEWKFGYQTITTPSNYNNTFHWYVGYSSTSYTGARYYTNLKMEVGTTPSPYHAGTRSSTQSLIDLKGNTNIDVDDISFNSSKGQITFDGTDDYINLGSSTALSIARNVSVFVVGKFDSLSGWSGIFGNSNGSGFIHFQLSGGTINVYLYGPGLACVSSSVVSTNQWTVLGFTFDGTTCKIFKDGVNIKEATTSSTANISACSDMGVGKVYSTDRFSDGVIPVVKVYNKTLTQNEITKNFNSIKKRFGI